MAEPLRPAATLTYGRENLIFVPTISSTLAPTVAEVNAASGLDITRIAFLSGSDLPNGETGSTTAEQRLGDTETFEYPGTTAYTGGNLLMQTNPQGAAASDGVKAWEKFVEGTTGYLLQRLGVARATAPAAGQFVHVWPVTFGPSFPMKSGEGESAEAAFQVRYFVTDKPQFKVAIAP